jgi:serine/threonine-protein kinase
MDLHQLYHLANDVVFIDATAISAGDKQHIDFSPTDVVITQGQTRKRSKVVSDVTAGFLKQFATPATAATALFHYAQQTKQNVEQLADAAFPLLVEMTREGYLVLADSPTAGLKVPLLQPGDVFASYTVQQKIQFLDDTAVYKVEDAEGVSCALKIFQLNGSEAPPEYSNEVRALQQLDGTCNPVLLQHGDHNGFYFLATTWIDGLPCEEVAAAYRNYLVKQNVLALVDLCLSITQAFDHLHAQGLLHGDVHPNNVLISSGSKTTIIDYGTAILDETSQRVVRGGVDFYYEPELATALLEDQPPVAVTAAGEQYALAVLLYKILTGHHYLSFSYEPGRAYQQIAKDKPLPFSAFDFPLPPSFDAVFAKALAKSPAERYSSMEKLAEALRMCRQEVQKSQAIFHTDKTVHAEGLVEFLIRRYSEGSFLQKGLQRAPTCSVNYGAAGIAYFLYRAAVVYDNATLLDVADVWANHAGAYTNNYNQAFYSTGDDITEATVGKRALYHSPTGVHLVQAMISSARGDGQAVLRATEDYLQACLANCQQIDLTLGKAGLLLGSALLLKSVPQLGSVGRAVVAATVNPLMHELWQQLDALPAMATEKVVDYFGIAHGWAGLLYATLSWCRETGTPLPEQFQTRQEELISLAIGTNSQTQWPVSNSNQTPWLGWCHGNAGYVFLWSLAYEHFQQDRFLQLSKEAAAPLFTSRPQTSNLCCGLAGEAYALLRLYQLTGSKEYLVQAQKLTEQMLQDLSSPDLRNHSLYKGELGIGLLACELKKPSMARMPLFC